MMNAITSTTCPKCGDDVAEANVRCRACGLPRKEFQEYSDAVDELHASPRDHGDSRESGSFELGRKPPSSAHFQVAGRAGTLDSREATTDSVLDLDLSTNSAAPDVLRSSQTEQRVQPTERQPQSRGSEPDPTRRSDDDVRVVPTDSSENVGGSSQSSIARTIVPVTCEHCGTLNQLPKTLAKSGVQCTRCGRPLVVSGDSSMSASTSKVDSQLRSLAGKDRRKILKRAVEKARQVPQQMTLPKLEKTLSRGEAKEATRAIEAVRNATEASSSELADATDAIKLAGQSQDKRLVDLLAGCCEELRDDLRGLAKRQLGAAKHSAAFDTLLSSLIDDVPEVYGDIIAGFGELGDVRAARTLATLGTYWPELEDAAIDALGAIGSRVTPVLISLAERSDKKGLRRVIYRALGEIQAAEGIPVLANGLTTARDVSSRIAAIRALGCIDDRSCLSPLVSALKDKDDTVRYEATIALSSHRRKRIVPALVHVLNDSHSGVRENAARLIGHIGLKQAVAPLSVIVSDPVPATRVAVLEALARLGDDTAVPQLGFEATEARAEGDEERLANVAKVLGELKDPRSILTLINAMPGTRPVTQSTILTALGEIGDPTVRPALVDAMTNGSAATVRVAAVKALGALGDVDSVEPLKKAVSAGPPLKPAAITALGQIESEEAVSILSNLLSDDDSNTRRLAVTALAANGDETVVRRLKPLMNDQDMAVQKAVDEAMVKLGAPVEEEAKNAKPEKKKKKVRVKKSRKPKLAMPSFDWNRLQDLQINDFVAVARENPLIPGIVAAVLAVGIAGYSFSGTLSSMVAGKDSSIVVRGLVDDISIAGSGQSITVARSFGVLDVLDSSGSYLLDVKADGITGIQCNGDASVIVVAAAGSSHIYQRSSGEKVDLDAIDLMCSNSSRTKVVLLSGNQLVSADMTTASKSALGTIELVPDLNVMATNAEASQVLLGAADGRVLVWNGADAELVQFNGPRSGIASLAYSPDSAKLVVGGSAGEVQVFEKGNAVPVVDIQTQAEAEAKRRKPVQFARFLNDQQVVIASGEAAKIIDSATGEVSREFPLVTPTGYASLSADGKFLASAGEESDFITVYAVDSGEKAWDVRIE